jgi:high-affinity iron transporter
MSSILIWDGIMFASPRLLLCLLSLLSVFSLNVFADPVEGTAQAIHLLDYIGADYADAVNAGQVSNSDSYQKQLDALSSLQGLILALPARPQRGDIEQGVSALHDAIAQHQDAAVVSRQARLVSAQVAAAYEVSQAPVITPDPTRGAPIYAQQCAVCHGDAGLGDGPAGIGLEPAPSNFTDAKRLGRLSLYDLYGATTLGIEGTDMPAFADQLDERQRWDLAVYIASFSAAAPAAAPAAVDGSKPKTFDLAELARQTPDEIAATQGEPAAALFRSQRAQPPVVQRGPQQLLDYTSVTLDKSLAAYGSGDHDQAYDLSVAAYLEGFELVESSLDNVDAQVRKDTEKALMAYRQSLQDGLPLEQAKEKLEFAKSKLQESAKLLGSDGLSQSLSFISALLILLREGLEAILVLAAILAFLRNTGQQSAERSVHIGWGLAMVAGVFTWAAAAYLFDVSGAQRELLEGCTALFAAVMVLWLGVWMHDRRHAAAWQDYIKSSLVGGGGRFGFAMLAFFSVYRELFEVILFYETLWLQAGPAGHSAVLGGALAACVLLVGLAWVILRGSARLPLGLFFGINAALLCALSVVFAGHGVKALQEAGVFGTHPVPFIEFEWLGVHADLYSLSAQAIALIAIAILYGRSFVTAKGRQQAPSAN